MNESYVIILCLYSYEVTCAVNNYECVEDDDDDTWGIVHVIIGMAGAAVDTQTYFNTSWSVYHDQVFGYTDIQVNATTLIFNYYHNDDDLVANTFTLKK